MIRSARLMSAPDASPDRFDSVLYQMQRMFLCLERSRRQSYDPLPFCAVYKDAAGQPVDVKVQMDAQQYLLGLIEKLENQLRGSPQAMLLQDTIRGTLANQMMCQGGCRTVNEREEFFYSIPLEVGAAHSSVSTPSWLLVWCRGVSSHPAPRPILCR